MLPILLGASVGQTGKVRPAMIALGFVMSFSMVALLLGAITRVFDFDPNHLRNAAAILLLGFGLLMIWPAPFEWLSSRIGGFTGGKLRSLPRQGLIGGFVLGTTLGLVWTPCAGPVLGSILTVMATSKDTAWASLLLVVYAIGAALPMLAIAYGGQAVTTRIRRVARIAPRLQQGFGVVVIGFALRFLLPVRHADRGVADRILPQRPDRPLTPPMETTMTLRSLAASTAIDAFSLAGSAMPAFCGEAARATETPFTDRRDAGQRA